MCLPTFASLSSRRFATACLLLLCAALQTPLVLAQQVLKLSTTTSTENSGLLTYLLPLFEATSGLKVQVIAVGTGKALELAKNGDVDVTLVHARPSEDKFVAAGGGVNRRDVMYNDFIIVGPASDPAGIRGSKDAIAAMKKIVDSRAKFISRGDNSGTDQMEKGYWKQVGSQPQGAAYVAAGLGMGEVLNMAAQLDAYTLTDRATYGAYKAKTGLVVAVDGDRRMFNPYGIIAVNPVKYKDINFKGAMQLIEWITSAAGQKAIGAFRVDGQQVFFPSANALAGTASGAQQTTSPYAQIRKSADGIGKSYLGREIAGVMGWQGAEWLERSGRAREERPDLLLAALALTPGMTVADVGAGTGYYTWQIAQKVGSTGRVYAVDVQPEMIALLNTQMKQRNVSNVVSQLGTERDTRLPAGTLDLALMVDVYHELEYPDEVLDSIVRALKPGGKVVFVEYRAEDPKVQIKPVHKMSETQVRLEAMRHGLQWERTITTLPIQHVIVFRKN